ncbi:MAG: hypothetical protein ACRDFR_03875 [Candidatus Limnocylindria bacterium]
MTLWDAVNLVAPFVAGALLYAFRVPFTKRVLAYYPSKLRPPEHLARGAVVFVAVAFVVFGVIQLLKLG